nr:uncharacterized protein LOC111511256 isoform X2 [Leptinotarsa decemlineata]
MLQRVNPVASSSAEKNPRRLQKNPLAISNAQVQSFLDIYIEKSPPSEAGQGDGTASETVVLACKLCGFRANKFALIQNHLCFCITGQSLLKKALEKNTQSRTKRVPKATPPPVAKPPPPVAKPPPPVAKPPPPVAKPPPPPLNLLPRGTTKTQKIHRSLLNPEFRMLFVCTCCEYSSTSREIYNMHLLVCPKAKMMQYNHALRPNETKKVEKSKENSKTNEVIDIDDEPTSEKATSDLNSASQTDTSVKNGVHPTIPPTSSGTESSELEKLPQAEAMEESMETVCDSNTQGKQIVSDQSLTTSEAELGDPPLNENVDTNSDPPCSPLAADEPVSDTDSQVSNQELLKRENESEDIAMMTEDLRCNITEEELPKSDNASDLTKCNKEQNSLQSENNNRTILSDDQTQMTKITECQLSMSNTLGKKEQCGEKNLLQNQDENGSKTVLSDDEYSKVEIEQSQNNDNNISSDDHYSKTDENQLCSSSQTEVTNEKESVETKDHLPESDNKQNKNSSMMLPSDDQHSKTAEDELSTSDNSSGQTEPTNEEESLKNQNEKEKMVVSSGDQNLNSLEDQLLEFENSIGETVQRQMKDSDMTLVSEDQHSKAAKSPPCESGNSPDQTDATDEDEALEKQNENDNMEVFSGDQNSNATDDQQPESENSIEKTDQSQMQDVDMTLVSEDQHFKTVESPPPKSDDSLDQTEASNEEESLEKQYKNENMEVSSGDQNSNVTDNQLPKSENSIEKADQSKMEDSDMTLVSEDQYSKAAEGPLSEFDNSPDQTEATNEEKSLEKKNENENMMVSLGDQNSNAIDNQPPESENSIEKTDQSQMEDSDMTLVPEDQHSKTAEGLLSKSDNSPDQTEATNEKESLEKKNENENMMVSSGDQNSNAIDDQLPESDNLTEKTDQSQMEDSDMPLVSEDQHSRTAEGLLSESDNSSNQTEATKGESVVYSDDQSLNPIEDQLPRSDNSLRAIEKKQCENDSVTLPSCDQYSNTAEDQFSKCDKSSDQMGLTREGESMGNQNGSIGLSSDSQHFKPAEDQLSKSSNSPDQTAKEAESLKNKNENKVSFSDDQHLKAAQDQQSKSATESSRETDLIKESESLMNRNEKSTMTRLSDDHNFDHTENQSSKAHNPPHPTEQSGKESFSDKGTTLTCGSTCELIVNDKTSTETPSDVVNETDDELLEIFVLFCDSETGDDVSLSDIPRDPLYFDESLLDGPLIQEPTDKQLSTSSTCSAVSKDEIKPTSKNVKLDKELVIYLTRDFVVENNEIYQQKKMLVISKETETIKKKTFKGGYPMNTNGNSSSTESGEKDGQNTRDESTMEISARQTSDDDDDDDETPMDTMEHSDISEADEEPPPIDKSTELVKSSSTKVSDKKSKLPEKAKGNLSGKTCEDESPVEVAESLATEKIKPANETDDKMVNTTFTKSADETTKKACFPSSSNTYLRRTTEKLGSKMKPLVVPKIEIPKDLAIFKCDSCSFNTRNHFRMENHVLSHFSQFIKNKEYLCEKCRVSYGTVGLFYDHLKMRHTTFNYKVFFWCVNCALVFRQKPDLTAHLRKCLNKDKIVRLFKSNLSIFCMMCEYETNDVNHAKTHLQQCRQKNAFVIPDVIEID